MKKTRNRLLALALALILYGGLRRQQQCNQQRRKFQ